MNVTDSQLTVTVDEKTCMAGNGKHTVMGALTFPNDTTGGCGNATCAGSVVLLMGVPHDEWGVDLEGVPAVEGGCSVRIAAQRLAAESGAAAVVVELPELPGEYTQEESDDLLRRISGAHAEAFPNASAGHIAPVVLLDLNATARLYAELLTGNVSNATVYPDTYLHDCSCFTFHPILLALILISWCSVLALWVSNTWGRNAEQSTTLHRVMVVVPAGDEVVPELIASQLQTVLADQVRAGIRLAVDEVATSDAFPTVWDGALRAVHSEFVVLMEGRGDGALRDMRLRLRLVRLVNGHAERPWRQPRLPHVLLRCRRVVRKQRGAQPAGGAVGPRRCRCRGGRLRRG